MRRYRARKARTVDDLTPAQGEEILQAGCFFEGNGECGDPLVLAHNVPLSKGGNTTKANIFCLCKRHNSQMGTKSLSEMLSQGEFFN